MTRIIAGHAGSHTLQVPKSGTRPTSDRVREAIFSSLEARDLVAGARVLDLYAGSGALGLEAASRGAAEVVLVERASSAARVCSGNARLVAARVEAAGDARRDATGGSAPSIHVVTKAVATFLASATGPWDLVFIDPPYDLGDAELARALELLDPLLSEDAVVVLERGARSALPALPARLELDRSTNYGDTVLHWLVTTGE
ncbi:MAG: RsmD family RNA methyltransferase [Microcella sp.]|uniref:RsmD family RNA methyltransferase n=1 Tax=Microcella sp. TaxID=1913979 RepID=UPI003315785F